MSGRLSNPPDLPSGIIIVTAAEAPDLWSATAAVFEALWPEYNMHGDVAGDYFGALVPRFSHLQFLLYSQPEGRALARGRCIPFAWDGSLDTLPAGIDALGLQAVHHTAPPTAL